MAQTTQGGGLPLPIAAISQAIPRLSRHDLEALAERLIDRLDEIDGPLEDREPEADYCTADDDRGSAAPWGTRSGFDEYDELPLLPISLNA